MMTKRKLEIAETKELAMEITARLRPNYSLSHLRSASYLTRDCGIIEKNVEWGKDEEAQTKHYTYANSAIILSVGSLEAFINELHSDAVEERKDQLGLAYSSAKKIVSMWDTVDREPVLRKYNWVLTLIGQEAYDAGSVPMQHLYLLVQLRNLLVHWSPEWSDDASTSDKFEVRVGKIFPHNALSKPDQLFIPYRCFGFGSGAWAVSLVYEFLVDYSHKLKIEPLVAKWEKEIKENISPT